MYLFDVEAYKWLCKLCWMLIICWAPKGRIPTCSNEGSPFLIHFESKESKKNMPLTVSKLSRPLGGKRPCTKWRSWKRNRVKGKMRVLVLTVPAVIGRSCWKILGKEHRFFFGDDFDNRHICRTKRSMRNRRKRRPKRRIWPRWELPRRAPMEKLLIQVLGN